MELIELISTKLMQEKTNIINEIEKLCRRADQCRSIHNMIKDRMVSFNRGIALYVAIGSAITAMFIFASLPDPYLLWFGIFSASIFVASIIPSTLALDAKILENKLAVQRWGEWIKDAKNFCNIEIEHMDLSAAVARQKVILELYKEVMESTPLIPDNKFNKYKRLHLQKIAISKALDKTPFKSIRKIKRDLKKADEASE